MDTIKKIVTGYRYYQSHSKNLPKSRSKTEYENTTHQQYPSYYTAVKLGQ
jgi:hypothetical protein